MRHKTDSIGYNFFTFKYSFRSHLFTIDRALSLAENDRIAGKEFCILSGAIKFVSVRSSPRATWAFSKLQWLQYYFPKTLDSIPSFRKVKILLIPLILYKISNPKVLGFLFFRNIAKPRE